MIPSNQELPLPGYALSLMAKIESETGRPVRLIACDKVHNDSRIIVGGDNTADHIVEYSMLHARWLCHYAVSGVFKIQRICRVPDHQRQFPEVSQELWNSLSPSSHQLIRQLINIPLDIRVERDLARSVPAHYPQQCQYLRVRARQLAAWITRYDLDGGLATWLPSAAMSAAYVIGAARITNGNYSALKRTPIGRIGNHLVDQLFDNSIADGYTGDLQSIDQWSSSLGLDGIINLRCTYNEQ